MIDLIGNIRTFLSRLTAARAGYLDWLNIGETIPTQAQINTQVDNALDTAVPGSPTANSINERIKTLDDHDLVTKIPGVVTAVGPTKAEMDTGHGLLATPAQVNTEVDSALDTAVPGAPTADSINERIKTIDDAGIPALVDSKVMGRAQIKEVSITSAANAGDVLVATITTQPCLIESIVIHADAAQTANMTSCGIFGGTGKVVTFIAAADALQADLDAADKQVAWQGAVRLAATKTIVISLVGTGAIAVDLTIVIKFRASVSGGYLA